VKAPRLLTVADYMMPDPITLEPEDSLLRAVEVMRLRGVQSIPIVLGGMLVGLIVEGDIKRAEPSTLTGGSQEEFNRVMEQTPISRLMAKDPVTVKADQPLVQAVEIFHSTTYGALPVVEDGRVIGILTDNDMLRALIDLLKKA
jgi:acetoin utilization protein AcuB